MKKIFIASLVATTLFTSVKSSAQDDKSKRPSPPATASATTSTGNTITIDYSQPGVKGRTIGKEIAPYGKVWRTGANEATLFEVSRDAKVEGKDLKAGKYSLFTIPGENEWQFILNSETGQWGIKQGGDANRDPAKDVLTFT